MKQLTRRSFLTGGMKALAFAVAPFILPVRRRKRSPWRGYGRNAYGASPYGH